MPSHTTTRIRTTINFPLELHYIKSLFLHKRYRQCIQTCRDMLKAGGDSVLQQPLQQTFINFYLGLAHEELARLMHEQSQAKIPAFCQAEDSYGIALQLLPSDEDAAGSASRAEVPVKEDPFVEQTAIATPTPPADDDEYDPYNYFSPSFTQISAESVPGSPPNFTDTNDLPSRSPQPMSRDSTSSDLESHSSFDQIMNPHKTLQRDASRMYLLDAVPQKGLQRDISRMSVLDSPPRIPPRPQMPKSVSQGLLRPIRPGVPPQAFHVPPRLPYVGSSASTSRLPKLITRNAWGSPIGHVPKTIREDREEEYYEAEPVSPISPSDWNDAASNASTISPVSPETPTRTYGYEPAAIETADPEVQKKIIPQEDVDQEDVIKHPQSTPYQDMATQLQTHLRLLHEAKDHAITIQTSRKISSTAPTNGTPRIPLRLSLDGSTHDSSRPESVSSKHDSVVGEAKPRRLPQSKSYWSFKPDEVSTNEKRRRIEDGRERMWTRERFDGRKYGLLAERALAEI
ncbi:hypothetical protein LTR78_008839 [Recurvomyces mirabilis]|uniref:Uncharacterized protein n=1 Tax=Recurvomyces mirabilis TaxID=574656 RepID=A0AAE0TP77_9PEZI|nr:hypothetical protein LTR78_008839 [Recurvomyces mirabilis]KAK5155754.1 hypothetical protein LTS14_005320 [Recurvomyces mirabilis]